MRAGVKYPGYDQQLKWSNKYEVFLPNGAEKAVRETTSATNAKNVKKDNAEVPAMHMPDAPNKSKIPVNPVNSQEHDEVGQGNPFVDDLSTQTTSPSRSLLNVNANQQVGRLIRKQRKMTFSHRFASLGHIRQLEKDMATASELEQYLVNLSYPREHTVVDPEDRTRRHGIC